MRNTEGGDNRFYNNIFVAHDGLAPYDKASYPMFMAGNVLLKGAKAGKHERNPLVNTEFDPAINLIEENNGLYLHITLDKTWAQNQPRQLVTTELLGRAKIPNLPYEKSDGSPYRINADYFGKKRNPANPFPGPFELPEGGKKALKVWPMVAPQ
ncbi:MAG: hypothetical protein ACYTGS_17815 [Planctomycetota bacterium]